MSAAYNCIVIDAPWPTTKIKRRVRPRQNGFDYPTMSVAELEEFGKQIKGWAAADCHLFCWATQKFLPEALHLVEAWGFRYVFEMVWHKPGGFQPIGLPQYNCEFVVYARRGAAEFIHTRDFFCCFKAPRHEHSRKPDAFYNIVRRHTIGPRLDVFSRERREGFDTWGNEANKFSHSGFQLSFPDAVTVTSTSVTVSCLVCGQAMTRQRSTRLTCSDACRKARQRANGGGK